MFQITFLLFIPTRSSLTSVRRLIVRLVPYFLIISLNFKNVSVHFFLFFNSNSFVLNFRSSFDRSSSAFLLTISLKIASLYSFIYYIDILIIRLINLGPLFYSFLKTFGKVKVGMFMRVGFHPQFFIINFFKCLGNLTKHNNKELDFFLIYIIK